MELVQIISTLQENGGALITGLFTAPREQKPSVKLLNAVLLVIVFGFGCLLWIRFLNYGQIPDNRLDWGDITYPRLLVAQQAVQQGVLPFHVDRAEGMKWITNRYFSVVDVLFSPQIVLLNWLSVGEFAVVQVIWMYALGFWGLVLFRRRFQLSFFAFLALFLVFNLNGDLVAHLAVGHLMWTAYFLLPFWVLWLLDVLRDQPITWRQVAWFSLLEFFTFAQGGYHQFVWLLFFMFFVFILNPQKYWKIFWGILFAILVNLYRILPAALLQKTLSLGFIAGFPTTGAWLKSMLEPVSLESAYAVANRVDVSVWEFDFFVGIVGGAFLLLGIWNLYRQKTVPGFKLMIPCLLMFALSFGNFYKPFFDSGLPLLAGERVSARFIILPLVIVLFLAAIQLQKLLDAYPSVIFRTGTTLLIFLLANDLTQHMAQWDIMQTPAEVFSSFPKLAVLNDPPYFGLLWIGTGISFGSLLFLWIKAWGKRFNRSTISSALNSESFRPFIVIITIGTLAGWLCGAIQAQIWPGTAGDFGWALRAANDLLAGRDVYAQPMGVDLVSYPLPAALVALPLAPLAPPVAAGIFFGLSSALLAGCLLRKRSYDSLLLFLSWPYFYNLLFAQWTPLILCLAFLSPLLALILVKPQIAIPPLVWHPFSRLGVGVLVGVGALSLALDPDWPWVWLSQTSGYRGLPPLFSLPFGPFLLLALLRFRDRRAWFFILCALMPQRVVYDQLGLLLVARTRRDLILLTACSWITLPAIIVLGGWVNLPGGWQNWIVVTLYFPALFVVLAG